MNDKLNRRNFMKLGSVAGLGAVVGGINLSGCKEEEKKVNNINPVKSPPIKNVRIGFIGLGSRGYSNLKDMLPIEGIEVKAVCDILEDKAERAQRLVEGAGQKKPISYTKGETDYKRMYQQEDIDLVIVSTPWNWHAPMCVDAMNAGKHSAVEVPAAVTLDECWELVEASEKNNKYCVILENCCYSKWMLMILNMVRQGIMGEMLYSEVGYLHDIRDFLFEPQGRALWRTLPPITRNGNLYPTHGLGPAAQCMNINRGDRFDHIVSMSTKSRGLNLYAAKKLGPDHPKAIRKYALGDVNTSLIRTVNGAVITLVYDNQSPRPYSRIDMVQGTKGIFRGYPEQKIYIEDKSPELDQWESAEKYYAEYEHPLWKALYERAKSSGHGGMDFIMFWRLIAALHTGTAPDIDVYDAASWSAVSELSERSVANKSKTIDFPDFTRGQWKTNKPLGIVTA